MSGGQGQSLGLISRASMAPTRIGPLIISAYTHIGKRPNQEDRFVIAPNLYDGEYCFLGVFDGTVKEYASEFVHKHILDSLLSSKSFQCFHALSADEKADKKNQLLRDAMYEMYAMTDNKLLQWCQEHQNHYSSTTAVTLLIHIPTQRMYVAHIGDSKIIMGKVVGCQDFKTGKQTNKLVGEELTIDHKPDMPKELERIENSGGSLTWLHGGKPFIRGGDFSRRKHAMQLNYSRAFGGKDLKMYGLSAEPDVSEYWLTKGKERVVILGSDGIWDVINATAAVQIAEQTQQQQKSPAVQLGDVALRAHETKGSADNVTSIVCFFSFP